jgi:hypothetical protein
MCFFCEGEPNVTSYNVNRIELKLRNRGAEVMHEVWGHSKRIINVKFK